MAYDLNWLSNATFADLDAAMNNIVTRREVEPLLRTKQGEAIAKRLIDTRGQASATSKQQYSIEWLRKADYAALKAALVDSTARPQVENLLRTVEGAKIASQLINDVRVVPPAGDEEVSAEEQAQIDADNARADEQAAAEAVVPATEVVAPAAVKTEEKVKIVRDYQVTDEQGNPLGRRTHLEGWTPEEIYVKYEAAHTNAVRYAERLKKRIDATETAQRTSQSAAQAAHEADEAVVSAKKENDPTKFNEAVKKTSVAEREKAAAERATAQYNSIIIEGWIDDHSHDYVPCEASAELLKQWLITNNKPLSYDNLEAAFVATKHKQPVPQRPAVTVSAEPVNNTQVPATTQVVAQAAPITQPAAAAVVPETPANSVLPQAQTPASETTSAKAGQSATARRPGVNGGLQPGAMSAQRPVKNQQTSQPTDRSVLMKEIARMDPVQYRKLVATSEEFRSRLKAAGIVDAGVR